MALSMDEQRMLAEIERRLTAEDPGLASRLKTFRRPGPATALRTTRGKVVGSVCTVVLLVIIGLTVYAMIPFRAHSPKTPGAKQPSASPALTVQTHPRLLPTDTSRPLPLPAPAGTLPLGQGQRRPVTSPATAGPGTARRPPACAFLAGTRPTAGPCAG
jgi:hypothetical protein